MSSPQHKSENRWRTGREATVVQQSAVTFPRVEIKPPAEPNVRGEPENSCSGREVKPDELILI